MGLINWDTPKKVRSIEKHNAISTLVLIIPLRWLISAFLRWIGYYNGSCRTSGQYF